MGEYKRVLTYSQVYKKIDDLEDEIKNLRRDQKRIDKHIERLELELQEWSDLV